MSGWGNILVPVWRHITHLYCLCVLCKTLTKMLLFHIQLNWQFPWHLIEHVQTIKIQNKYCNHITAVSENRIILTGSVSSAHCNHSTGRISKTQHLCIVFILSININHIRCVRFKGMALNYNETADSVYRSTTTGLFSWPMPPKWHDIFIQ
jgi:hypothetical protein